MKTLYIECNMGVAGDMLMSALLELHSEPENFIKRLNALNIPNVEVKAERVLKCGIMGTHIKVSVNGVEESENIHEHKHRHHHHHTGLHDVEHIISNLNVSDSVKNNAVSVYRLIAEAEANAHGRAVDNIHFHEVGTMDAVTDVVGNCMLIEELKADEIIASPIRTGYGQVKCAHGILPVPAPATTYILRNIPVYAGDEEGEMCTPTGAALIEHFAEKFVSMPFMRIEKTGYGMGTKDFKTANCVRAFLGETEDKTDRVTELNCNIDDMTGEHISYAVSRMFEAGALDVFTTPIYMKKNRPAFLLTCICAEADRDNIVREIFKHTSTLGIREKLCHRYILERKEESMTTNFGNVRVKKASGYGVNRIKAEYDDIAEIADKNNISLRDIKLK